MNDILTKICEFKKQEIAKAKKRLPQIELEHLPVPKLRDFKKNLQGAGLSIIAEVKRKSPSAGLIKTNFHPVQIAKTYEQSGVDAISILTDTHFFGGSLNDLQQIRTEVNLPLLRKDFIIDPYQIYESRTAGADAILLIVRALSENQLKEYLQLSKELGLTALVEAHTAEESETAIRVGSEIIGINNRNLGTFTVDLQISIDLKAMIPDSIVTVSESGIKTGRDTARLKAAGFDAILIGETLMRAMDVGRLIRILKRSSDNSPEPKRMKG